MNHRRHTLTTSPQVEYACAIERPADHSDLIVLVASLAAGALLLALAVMEWLA